LGDNFPMDKVSRMVDFRCWTKGGAGGIEIFADSGQGTISMSSRDHGVHIG